AITLDLAERFVGEELDYRETVSLFHTNMNSQQEWNHAVVASRTHKRSKPSTDHGLTRWDEL
ncbi:hypothetical protein CH063_12254, partial [Colletotrichum higginsianum]